MAYIPYYKPDAGWYCKIHAEQDIAKIVLKQGDIITRCSKYIPIERQGNRILSNIEYYNVVILSQSYDLTNKSINDVTVCPINTINNFFNAHISEFLPKVGQIQPKDKARIEDDDVINFALAKIITFKSDLMEGKIPYLFLLDKCKFGEFNDYLIVDFRNVFEVNINILLRTACDNGERIRLLSPYNEGLSQAFGLFYMRAAQSKEIDNKKYFPIEDNNFALNALTAEKMSALLEDLNN